MPVWLITLLPTIWYWLKRLSGVILIGALILVPIIGIHQYGDRHYKVGYQEGYAKAVKERPTYGSVGTVTNVTQEAQDYKWLGLKLNVWKFKIGLGL